jgi:SPP1 gp7 family putative phage head morphogenesis protein
MAHSEVQATLDPIITDNINLIKSIPAELLPEVEDEYRGIITDKGFDQKEILDMLTRRFSVATNRATLIATDQVGKTIGALDRTRQTQAKVTHFVWRTSEDSAVRSSHAVLDGRVFTWSSPPSIGIPGQPIRCRCVALPKIDVF